MKNLIPITNLKRIAVLILMSIFLSSGSFSLFAQKCKPDILTVDKITKKKYTAWTSELYETGMGEVIFAGSTATLNVTLIIGTEQDAAFIQLISKKAESSKQNANYNSQLKGSKGNEFMLGLKEGEPLIFSATDVENVSKVGGLNELVTTISYVAYITNEQLPLVMESISSKTIDAFRIKFDNDVVIEKSVKERVGENMQDKASCFKNYLKDKGLLK